jgi:hypothetical protein
MLQNLMLTFSVHATIPTYKGFSERTVGRHIVLRRATLPVDESDEVDVYKGRQMLPITLFHASTKNSMGEGCVSQTWL